MEWLNTFVVHKHALYMQLLEGKKERGKGRQDMGNLFNEHNGTSGVHCEQKI